MAKQYYRKSDSSDSAGWIKMSGSEFYQFVRDPQNRNRHFIDMGDVVIESPESIYREYKSEENHRAYIERQQTRIDTVSLQSQLYGESVTLLETIEDQSQDVEADALQNLLVQNLREVLSHLPEDEHRMIYDLYLSQPRKTVNELSEESGIPTMTLQNKKIRILAKLRRSLEGKV